MKASGEFVRPSSSHPEHCAIKGHSFCNPKAEKIKEASPETGEVEGTMEITSSEGALKTEDVTGTQDVSERDGTMARSDFIVLRYVKMMHMCEVVLFYGELLNWGKDELGFDY